MSWLSRREFLKVLLRHGLALGASGLGWRLLAGCGRMDRAAPRRPALTPPPPSHELRFHRRLAEQAVQCQVCFRTCVLLPGQLGHCHNVKNVEGRAFSLVHSRPCVLQVDPIEKEPVFHMLPGSRIFCTGTASCNFHCKYCQNWEFAQRTLWEVEAIEATPAKVVARALEAGCRAVSFTYNDPIVFYDYMLDILEEARAAGMRTLCHTNGSLEREALRALLQRLDAIVVDLKGFSESFYRQVCGAELAPVLRALEEIGRSGTHLEVVHLLVPRYNDHPAETRRMCRWIASTLGADTPLHFLRFFPSYRLQRLPPTPVETLEQAAQVALEEGLRYVYIGNLPGHPRNSTYCPSCGRIVIERIQFAVYAVEIEQGRCRFCGTPIPGIWE
ncbi:MAG: AmmeMemoRadiSam system radical SAM enzyme [Chloroflexia bacterium]